MKWPAAWIAIGCAALATASEPMDLEIQGEPDAHFLTWTTRPDFNYQVEASPDLET